MIRRTKNNKGFTLAELLIVVAIIAVLVAVSIPIFTRQLEKAREATDLANMRAAKAAFISAYLADNEKVKEIHTFWYDADRGILVTERGDMGYGEGTELAGYPDEYGPGYYVDGDYKDAVIVCFANEKGQLFLRWVLNESNPISEVEIDPTKDLFYVD